MVKRYNNGIYIDDEYYDVPLLSMKRNFPVLDKFAERNEEDGDLKREILGVYSNYDMAFGFGDGIAMDMELYAKLIEVLTRPQEFHKFAVPDIRGYHEFKGYISSTTDEVYKMFNNKTTFKNLTTKFTAKKPFRTP